jgi:predicted nucleotidyltransferase
MPVAEPAHEGLEIDAATLAAVAELCRRYHVRRLDIFGSAVRADFDPTRSDIDLIATFESIPFGSYLETHEGLVEGLETLFGRKVDLLTDQYIENPYLRRSIEEDRRPLFGQS